MAGRSFFFRLAISAAFYAAAAGSCSLARADAESESQFGFQPPHGWVRSVGKDRTVYYPPQDAVASCFIAVRPPRRSINDSELSKYFNSEFESQINHLQSSNP